MPSLTEPLKAEVVIYTDGGVDPNPGQGGWGAILLFENNGERTEREISGNVPETTTNNRMEITAMLEGLKALKRPCDVMVYTDSNYLKNGIGDWSEGKPGNTRIHERHGWVVNWKSRGWRRRDGPLLNVDLWQELWEACEKQKGITMRWIRGHSEDYYNERCDVLATKARLRG